MSSGNQQVQSGLYGIYNVLKPIGPLVDWFNSQKSFHTIPCRNQKQTNISCNGTNMETRPCLVHDDKRSPVKGQLSGIRNISAPEMSSLLIGNYMTGCTVLFKVCLLIL